MMKRNVHVVMHNLRNDIFKALLRKNQGRKLGKNQKVLIEAWELYKKHNKKMKKVI